MSEEKKPYQLPEGWVWVKLNEICISVERANTIINPLDKISYIDIKSVNNKTNTIDFFNEIEWINAPSRAQQIVKKGDLLFSSVRPYLKNIAYVASNHHNQIASTGFCVIRPILVDPKYIFYYIISEPFVSSVNKLAKGTSYPAVTNSVVMSQQIPLTSLQHQKLIVAKIEELFSELDKSVESLEKAKRQLEIYRRVLLKDAFKGKLTKKWRKVGEWKLVKIEELCRVVRGGSPRPAGDPRYYNGSIPFLKVADLTKDDKTYVISYKYTIKEAGLSRTRLIPKNTLLLSNSGATLGVPKITNIEATINDGIAAFLGLDERILKYMYYFWRSKTQELRLMSQGAGQPNLNTTIISNVLFPKCSFEEMDLITREIESQFSLIDKLDSTIVSSLNELNSLRSVILKKAFEGLLTEQNNAESASELLDIIRQVKETFFQEERLRPRIKLIKMEQELKGILEILQDNNTPIEAKKLWELSIYQENIDSFYAELKKLIESGKVRELTRQGKDSFITLTT